MLGWSLILGSPHLQYSLAFPESEIRPAIKMALVTTRTIYFLWLHSMLKTTLTAITTTLFTSLRFSAWFALWTPVNAVNDDTFAWRRFKEGDRDAELSFSSFTWHTVSRLTVSQLSSLFVTLPMCDPFLTAIDFLLVSRPCGWNMTSFIRHFRNEKKTKLKRVAQLSLGSFLGTRHSVIPHFTPNQSINQSFIYPRRV